MLKKLNFLAVPVLFLSIFLAVPAFAKNTQESEPAKAYTLKSASASGKTSLKSVTYSAGDSITASFDSSSGTLTLTGSGEMNNFSRGQTPWYQNKNSIKQLIVGEGISSIGNFSFAECTNLAEVKFPSTLKSIGDTAFYQCMALTNVSFPDSLETLGEASFADCSKLSTITFGKGLKKIGDYAFQGIAATALALPEGMTDIGDYIFYHADIEYLTIPKSVVSLGAIGYGAENLASVTVVPGNTNYISENGVLFTADQTTLICYPAGKTDTSYTVPDSVVKLNDYAFAYAARLQSISIGNHVTTIGDWVFYQSGLRSAVIPDSVTALGNGPFDQCYYLTAVTIGSGIQETPYRLFQDCRELQSVTFKEGLENITMRCMMNCNKITSVTLPSTVKRIENYAFYNCTALESINIPQGTQYIGGSAFSGCENISYTVPDGLTKLDDGSYRSTFSLRISGNYHYQKAYECLDLVNQERAAQGLTPLTMDTELLEAAMLRAGETAVYWDHTRPSGQSCFSVSSKAAAENIAAGSSTAAGVMNQWMNSAGHRANILTEGRNSIGIGCFSQGGVCFWVQLFSNDTAQTASQPQDKSVTLDILTDADMDFQLYFPYYDLTLKPDESMQIDAGLINLGWDSVYASLDPSNLNWSVDDPSIATVDANGTLTGHSPGTTYIRFALKSDPSIALSEKITVKKESTPQDTDTSKEENITQDKDTSKKEPSVDNVSETTNETFTCSGDEYKISSNKSKTLTYLKPETAGKTVVIPSYVIVNGTRYKVTAISPKAFKNNKTITSVKLGSYVTKIGNEAFYGCTNLKKVTVNKKLTQIGNYAFKNCKKLTSFQFPSTLKKVGKQAFYGCKKLKTLTVKTKKLKSSSIGSSAFKKTYSKMKIKVPSSKYKSYKKILKSKGISKKAVIRKS